MEGKEFNAVRMQEREEIFSKTVKTANRTYFFDVKSNRFNEFFLTITESKKRLNRDGSYYYEKYKIFLLKEDFERFTEALTEALEYINIAQPASPQKFKNEENWNHDLTKVEFDDLNDK